MESTISKTLSVSTPSSIATSPGRCIANASRLGSSLRLCCIYADRIRIRSPTSTSAPSLSPPASMRYRLQCVSSSAAPFGAFGGHGGGGGRIDGEDEKAKSVVDGAEEASGVSSDVIILDVGGNDGGCAATVKRILENQPQHHWDTKTMAS